MNGIGRQSIIVAGVDGSGESLVAAHWAATEALRRRFRLRLVHGSTDPPSRCPGYILPSAVSRELHNAAQEVLDVAVQSISASFPHLELTTSLVNEDARKALVDSSAGAVLTVVGTRGRGRVPEVLLGSVALHLASHGRSPIAVVPAGTILDGPRSDGPILLGVDESTSCQDAIGYAFDEAGARKVELIAVLVVDDRAVPRLVRGPARPGSIEDEAEKNALATQLAPWAQRYPDVSMRPIVLHGSAAEALLDYGLSLPLGAGPCMVVTGGRGRGALAGFLLGSTGQSLITHAGWPVLVVRSGVVRHPWSAGSASTPSQVLATAD